MAFTSTNGHTGDAAQSFAQSFLETGKHSDFKVKISNFMFKVHKYVLCSKSAYFDVTCSNKFKEGQQGYIELPQDEDPVMLARLLQAVYHDDYGTAQHDALLPVLLRNALADDAPISLATDLIDDTSYLTHAKLYAMADIYQFPVLSTLAKWKFVACINEPNFAMEDIIKAIDIVYSTTPDSNDGLRKYIVFKAQSNIQNLKKLESFARVYEDYFGFSWDFGLEYGGRKRLWCMACNHDSKIPSSCSCGFHGLCGGSRSCNEMDWSALKCTNCKKGGQLVRDKPSDDADDVVVMSEKRRSLPAISQPPASRKRKSM